MKFTLDWLRTYVAAAGCSAGQIASYLTMLGLEVDTVQALNEHLAPLQTGRILSAEKHPDADKLQVCRVKIGADIHTIVCGAPNARAGLNVVVALPGTTLPGDVKIKKAKVRGVESSGMICSERELGLSTDHSGILELPVDIADGQSFIAAMGLHDTLIEVDLTPNRPDCASVIGIAREIAGKTGEILTLPAPPASENPGTASFTVTIEAPNLCPRYCARLVRGVRIGPSPWWLRQRLLAIGLRPINNVVDITNFVMMEYGQPLHAFDFDRIAGAAIIVRQPAGDETAFTTLDGSERPIDRQSLFICDAEKPVALAGVMGGLNSEVTSDTSAILLESACFSPVSIRKTSRKTGLATDASYRFERGVDIEGTLTAMQRAVDLLCSVAGGTAEAGWVDAYPGQEQRTSIALSARRTSQMIGVSFTTQSIATLLASIGIPSQQTDSDTLLVSPPSFRIDIEREADLIEEVARLYGYDAIPVHLPTVALSYPEQDSSRLKRRQAAATLLAAGSTEVINYSFSSSKMPDLLQLAADDTRRQHVHLLNPLNEEQGVLRTMLLPGLLDNLRRNISFQTTAVQLFEIGKVFRSVTENEQPLETMHLAAVFSGNRHGSSSTLHFPAETVDIFDAKGAAELLFSQMHLPCGTDPNAIIAAHPLTDDIEHFVETPSALHFLAGDLLIGQAGKVKNEVLRLFGIKQDVFYFELNFDALCSITPLPRQFTALPVYPAVVRDIALIVPSSVAAGNMVATVQNSGEKLIETVELFDIFQGGKIPAGFKSVALSVTYRSSNKTLTEKSVEKSHQKIVQLLTATYGGSLRDA